MRRVLTILMILPFAGPLGAQDLTGESYARWRDFILPKPQELLWQRIPWRPSWDEALAEAKEKDRPILMWTMKGHPLGDC